MNVREQENMRIRDMWHPKVLIPYVKKALGADYDSAKTDSSIEKELEKSKGRQNAIYSQYYGGRNVNVSTGNNAGKGNSSRIKGVQKVTTNHQKAVEAVKVTKTQEIKNDVQEQQRQ